MGQSSLAAADDKAAALLGGRYKLGRLLGQGGMGAVYEAVDRASGTTIAIKRLAANASDKTQALFEREYKTLSGLRHPCIVEVYDYGSDHGGSYYNMELLDGHDLAKRAHAVAQGVRLSARRRVAPRLASS